MILLIDTHALIWYIEGNKKLRKYVVSVIENTENTVFVSKVSLWEMAIKMSLNFKIRLEYRTCREINWSSLFFIE